MESHHPNCYSLHHFSERFIHHHPGDDPRGQSQRWPSRLPGSPWLTGHLGASQQGPCEPCGGPLDSVSSDVFFWLMENTPWYHGIYGDLTGFYSDLMWFYSVLWDIYSDLMGFYSDLMGY